MGPRGTPPTPSTDECQLQVRFSWEMMGSDLRPCAGGCQLGMIRIRICSDLRSSCLDHFGVLEASRSILKSYLNSHLSESDECQLQVKFSWEMMGSALRPCAFRCQLGMIRIRTCSDLRSSCLDHFGVLEASRSIKKNIFEVLEASRSIKKNLA